MMAGTARVVSPRESVSDLTPRGWDRIVTLLAVTLLAVAVVPQTAVGAPGSAVLVLAPLILWAITAVLPANVPPRVTIALFAAIVVLAAAAAAFSTAVAGVPGLLALIRLLTAPVVAIWVGGTFGAVAAGIIGAGAIAGASPFSQTLILIGAAAAAAAVGFSRRQSRVAAIREEEATRELLEAHSALAKNAAAEERRRIARDLHDVLAHSLGGLVLQLDAVEGLLEAGKIDEARVRAASSRRLAAEGLQDARAAVRVLDDDDVDVDVDVLAQQIQDLVETERELGASIDVTLPPVSGQLTPTALVALHAAAKEALTNARKHSPGGDITVALRQERNILILEISNEKTHPGPLSDSGSGPRTVGDARAVLHLRECNRPDRRWGAIHRTCRGDHIMIRVSVVDDQEIVRDGLVTLVGLMTDITVIGTAANGNEAVKVVALERPDVVLMDLRMPVQDGVEATSRIRSLYPDTRVLVLTTYDDDESIARALQAGAAGYLTKDAGRQQLESAIRSVADGQAVLAPSVAQQVLQGFQPSPEAKRSRVVREILARWPELSAREADVAERLRAGQSNTEIADELFISVATVKSHINKLFAKLGVTGRPSAIEMLSQVDT